MGQEAGQGGNPRSGRITQASIEQVLQRADLVDLASGFTQLRKQGNEHTGRCPFHDERSPSFSVNPAKGVYHCFGCGASGDVITFVQQKQGLDFIEGVEYLADRYRVQLEYDGDGPRDKGVPKRRLYELLETTTAFYQAYLEKSAHAAAARAYLQQRGVSDETARAFRIGFSPEEGTGLAPKALAKGYSREELLEARLLTSRGSDFFRGRLMVPIIDRADRVVAFGARKLRDDQFGGKYVNSADGRLFHKKETVFLAPGIRKAAQDAGEVIVVEGYMDVIALWQSGFRNACAVMGTSLTEQQVVELKRLAPRASFAFDPDTAGQVATLRALGLARQHELEVRVILLPDGDPADVLGALDGREQMQDLLEHGVSLLHYRVSALLGSADLATDAGREQVWREGMKFFATVPDSPERRRQLDRFAFGLGLDSAAVAELQRTAGSTRPFAELRAAAGSRRDGGRGGDGYRGGAHRGGGHGGSAPVPQGPPARSARDSAALLLERRFLAVLLLASEEGVPVSVAAVPEEAMSLDVHRRALQRLRDGGAATLAPAEVRDDEELASLVAQLVALAQEPATRRVEAETEAAAPIDELLAEMALRVELRYLDREAAKLRSQLDDLAALEQWRTIQQRRRELDPRATVPEA